MDSFRKSLITVLSIVLCFFTIIFVNYNIMQPKSSLAIFVLLGMVMCFLVFPGSGKVIEPNLELAESEPKKFAFQKKIWNVDIAIRWILAILTTFCSVSYTHLPSPRDLSTSRMPSSA